MGVPLLIITYCYFHIFKAARNQGQQTVRVHANSATHAQQAREKAKHRKTAFTIGIIIGVFVFLFSPNFVFSVLVFIAENFCEKMSYGRNWYWALLLVFLSSAVNPWIYAIRLREFRKAMKIILKKVFCCSSAHEDVMTSAASKERVENEKKD